MTHSGTVFHALSDSVIHLAFKKTMKLEASDCLLEVLEMNCTLFILCGELINVMAKF